MKIYRSDRVVLGVDPKMRSIPGKIIERHLIDTGHPVEQLVDQLHLQEAVRLALDGLSIERRVVLALTFGIDDHTGSNWGSYTLEEIARVMKTSRERVAAVRATTLLILQRRKTVVQRLQPFTHL